MSYFDAYNSTDPNAYESISQNRRSEPQTPLQAAIAVIIDDAASMAGGGNPGHEDYDLAAMENAVREYAARMALYSDAPHEYVNAVGADKIAARRGAYRYKNPAGLPIAHDDELRRRRKEALRKEIFGEEYKPMKGTQVYRSASADGGVWPSPQQHLMPGHVGP